MPKAVMISINPKWCELIANHKKTVEIRKSKPKLETPFKCYIYCTNGKPTFGRCLKDNSLKETPETDFDNYNRNTLFRANGKVIGEFVCDSIDQYDYDYCPHPEIGMDYDCGDSWWEIAEEDLENACLTYEDFKKYAYVNEVMYGWHISDLKIYDTPLEINDFVSASTINTNCFGQHLKHLDRAPQSWCYVEEVNR